MTIDVQNPANAGNNGQGNNTKVSPFGQNQAQTLAASHSIQMANQASKTLDLGNTPANARNINVQSVMAESSKMMDGGLQPLQVNLRKTLYAQNNASMNDNKAHYATINGESGAAAAAKLNHSVIVASDKQKSINVQAPSHKRENYHQHRKSIQAMVNQAFDDNVIIVNSES